MLKRDSEYLSKRGRGFLATGQGERLSIVPICFAHQEDVIYTAIDLKPKGARLARLTNIVSNPHVAFIVDNYSTNWRLLSYLLIHGDAEIVANEEERRRARRLLQRKYPQYRWLKLGKAPVIAIRVRRSKFWRFRDVQSSSRAGSER